MTVRLRTIPDRLRCGPRSSYRPWSPIAGAIILLLTTQVLAEQVVVFRDSEDLILDGAAEDVDSYSPATAVNSLDQAVLVWSDTQAGAVDTLMGVFSRNLDGLSDIVFVNELFQDTTTRSPRVATGSDNGFTIAWSDNRSTEGLFDVFLTRISNDANKLFKDIRVNEAFNDTNVETPDVALIGDGLTCVCWVDNRQNLRDVYARRFWESGAPVDARDFVVNPGYDDTDAIHPRVSGDTAGTAVIVWSDNRLQIHGPPTDSRSDIFARILPRSAIPNDTGDWPGPDREIQVTNVDLGTDDALDPDIAGNGYGLYVVAWRNQPSDGRDQHIYAAVITSSGQRLTEEFQVDLAPSPASTADPAVTFLGHDIFLISWYDEREGGLVIGRIYDAAIQQFVNDEFVITEQVGPVAGPAAASFSDRAFVTAWGYGESGTQDVLGNVHLWDLLGDLNVDARVAAHDLYWFATRWQPRTTSSTAADLDVDGYVDGRDIRILRGEFRTNLADRQPLTFSVKSLTKSPVHRKISTMNVKRARRSSEKPRREDRTKPARVLTTATPIIPGGQTPPASYEKPRSYKPVRVRSPRPTLHRTMNGQPSGAVQNHEGQQRNQTPRKGLLFFAGKWR